MKLRFMILTSVACNASIPSQIDAIDGGYPILVDGNIQTPEGRIIEQNPMRLSEFEYANWRYVENWYYRGRVLSVFPDTIPNAYPKMRLVVDSCLYGSPVFIGDTVILDIRGNRPLSTYPKGYWEHWQGLSILLYSSINAFTRTRFSPTPRQYFTDYTDFDDVWYFSNADTVWNDWAAYGTPLPLKPIIDSLRSDSIRLANTPVLSTPTVSTEPVELWSLSGENLWSGRDWHKSGLPTGVYLLKNRDVQRVVWVE